MVRIGQFSIPMFHPSTQSSIFIFQLIASSLQIFKSCLRINRVHMCLGIFLGPEIDFTFRGAFIKILDLGNSIESPFCHHYSPPGIWSYNLIFCKVHIEMFMSCIDKLASGLRHDQNQILNLFTDKIIDQNNQNRTQLSWR